MGYQVLAISGDVPEKAAEMAENQGLTYPVLSDEGLALTRRFGIAFQRGNRAPLPVPAVFLVDTEGTIQFHYVHPNYRLRLDLDVLIAAAKAGVKTE